MSGSVFFVGLIVAIGVALAVFATPLFLIPAVVVAAFALFAAPMMARMQSSDGKAGDASGVPTTSEASYDPVSDPGESA